MPFISTVTTKTIDKETRELLKSELGKIIEDLPGKTERWLMLSFEDNIPMYFKGDDSSDTAYIEVKIFGSAPDSAYDKFTADICALYESKLGISSDRIYVKYEECERWGWNGSNF